MVVRSPISQYIVALCCRIALVLEYFQLEKNAETMQKNGIEKCNSEKGKNDKCKKNASLRKAQTTIAKKMRMKHASLRKANMTIAKKNGIEKCKFQKGENNNCKTNALNNVSLREDTVANEDNLKEAQVTNAEHLERTRASWKKTHITCGKTLREMRPGKREHGTCSTNRNNKSAWTG